MKISVYQGRCVSSGQCVMAVPRVFDQRDKDGVTVLLGSDPGAAARPSTHALPHHAAPEPEPASEFARPDHG
jgi:ferredoxin